jgi:hypothetical protein
MWPRWLKWKTNERKRDNHTLCRAQEARRLHVLHLLYMHRCALSRWPQETNTRGERPEVVRESTDWRWPSDYRTSRIWPICHERPRWLMLRNIKILLRWTCSLISAVWMPPGHILLRLRCETEMVEGSRILDTRDQEDPSRITLQRWATRVNYVLCELSLVVHLSKLVLKMVSVFLCKAVVIVIPVQVLLRRNKLFQSNLAWISNQNQSIKVKIMESWKSNAACNQDIE